MPVQHQGKGGFILGQTTWEEFLPWLRPGATAWLAEHLPPGARVFEWGAGASTVWLARRGYQVISLELDGEWHAQVRQELEAQGLLGRVQLLHFPPRADEMGRLREYADHIMGCGTFDLVLIDGRNRNRCLGNARPHAKVGGYVCLDNSERWEYAAGRALYDDWPGLEWGDDGWSTAIWTRPEGDVARVELDNADA